MSSNTKLIPDGYRRDPFLNYDLRRARIFTDTSFKEVGEQVGVTSHAIENYERLRCFPLKNKRESIDEYLFWKIKKKNEIPPEIQEILDRGTLFPEKVREITSRELHKPFLDKKCGDVELDVEECECRGRIKREILGPDSILEQTIRKEKIARVNSEIDRLGEWRREIIRKRFGIGDERESSFREIGEELGFSPQRVSYHYNKAIESLRYKLER